MEGRVEAPGGWRRALAGFLIGAAVGALVALVLPRRPAVDETSSRPPE